MSSGKRLICWFSSPAQPRWEGCFADNRISNFFQINRIIIDYYYSCGATGRPSKHISKIGMPQFRNPQPINLKLGTRDHVVSFTLHAKIHSGRPSGGIPVDRWVAFWSRSFCWRHDVTQATHAPNLKTAQYLRCLIHTTLMPGYCDACAKHHKSQPNLKRHVKSKNFYIFFHLLSNQSRRL